MFYYNMVREHDLYVLYKIWSSICGQINFVSILLFMQDIYYIF